jgi:hypothetical protein
MVGRSVVAVLLAGVVSLGVGCSGDTGPRSQLGGGGSGQPGGSSGGGGGGGGEDAGPDVGPLFVEDSPDDTHEFLYRGFYLSWPGDQTARNTEAHGPVRLFFNPTLNDAIQDGAFLYPRGSAAALELYNANTDELIGWAAMVKIADNGDRNDWYYYETFDTEPDGNFSQEGVGAPLCADCHQAAPDYIY